MERKAIFVTPEVHKVLKVASAENGVSMNEVISILIDESTIIWAKRQTANKEKK